MTLSTDDEGVSRSKIIVEDRKAVEDQGVGYTTLKAMARNSLDRNFRAFEKRVAGGDWPVRSPHPASAAQG